MLKETLHQESEESVDINLSPMIDVVFILLIFFILTTVFVEETGIDVDKPEAASSVPLEQDSILIAISADERVYYGGREIGLSGIRPTIQRVLLASDASVIIQADKAASHGVFARAYGEARAAGARKIHFSTRADVEE
ncbi:MAG: biopolymer transporter ExbD [Verrucomicrobia bacterium]|nr:MAG: biopolymer transporter ExbD [Verrucomicrobiota bacterium]